ncbi:MAG: cell division ATP-binding protein FtsE [Candidatus Margulisiibacteriota bacterium]|nr:MAG: cell division ATP-binding protein FtsE [Candidatus Margulisbacteria bacterium GWD2_39_127]PZM82244.1 MAG: cell division ATP-binding protein FtsE [Candidatus Margulisiibacteriota bacterium]HAR63714.1 cell division ATP-binding protein FtsE [Candidatus Margulisiibacteriota bacterium]HCY35935.1 cell division ATP-binding protein FtsE [Candidatus Margulisiibacteriota bacterium]
MIKLQNVTKVFPNGYKALADINLHIGVDEFVFLVGSSGAGKSTLMKLLLREDVPSAGNVYIDSININKLHIKQVPMLRRSIGVIFQDYKLLPRRTVYENVAFALEVVGRSRMHIRRQVAQVLDLVGLLPKQKNYPAELSGGEQQRVCIARAIANNPTILLADEPTGNLDPNTSWEIMLLLQKINKRKTTVLVATHNKSIVDTMRKRVIAIENGKIVRDQQLGAYGYEF